MKPLADREILLGISGSIAAYKAADLCSRLGKLGANVHVVLTPAASQFVGAATFRALTRNPVLCDVFDEPMARRIAHIDLAQSADLVLVAPASADVLARMAHGMADDMLSTCMLATPPATPLLVAPAMNTLMWEHPATVANVQTLRARGVHFIAPGHGLLACQDVGTGKLADVEAIVAAVQEHLRAKPNPQEEREAQSVPGNELQAITAWKGRHVLITAGATREPLDPVRFLSNRSSGKMGYAIAAEARTQGATVTLVSGFATAVPPPGVDLIRVQTAQEMLEACQKHFRSCDVFIAAAAVADYAPETVHAQKIKKPMPQEPVSPALLRDTASGEAEVGNHEEIVTLRLKRTPDIVATLARGKRDNQIVVGFAAETEHLLDHARAKLESKRLDLIVANDVTREGAGFEGDTNIVTLLWPDGRADALPQMSKQEAGRALLDALLPLLPTEQTAKHTN